MFLIVLVPLATSSFNNNYNLHIIIITVTTVLISFFCINHITNVFYTVVPALGDPRRERTPAMYGHVINVPTHFNVTLPAIGGHLPNADADSHLLVVRTCYNGQFKQMPRFRRSFQPKIARGGHPNLRPTFCSNVHAAIW